MASSCCGSRYPRAWRKPTSLFAGRSKDCMTDRPVFSVQFHPEASPDRRALPLFGSSQI
jgi:hypothetical protein